ncbi:MAG: LysM peptidoglycan-binding domain-containing protein [Anaerolineaceae bacterium]|nr:LysM peptidoglycan-binding domain-containing protein [Anaerolineaceae bacterium]
MNKLLKIFTIILLVILLTLPAQNHTIKAAPLQSVTTTDLINLINGWRTANGYPALVVDPILMTTAYDTAVYMAVNGLRTHIGDVSGRITAYGYGGGATVFATENFAIGPWTIEQIAVGWSDEAHMFPATNPSYLHIGAGVYEYGDRVWYIVHAAYTSGAAQYTPNPTQLLNANTSTPSVSQLIIPVQTVTPNENGAVVHEVLPGQALWSIAIAYDTKIEDLIRLNNLNPADPTIYVGDKLLIFEAVRTPVNTEISPTIDPSQVTPTTTATIRPTRTKTATPRPSSTRAVLAPSTTPEKMKNQNAALSGIFQNKVIGVILISILALGILLIVTGSFGKKPSPPDQQKEEDE